MIVNLTNIYGKENTREGKKKIRYQPSHSFTIVHSHFIFSSSKLTNTRFIYELSHVCWFPFWTLSFVFSTVFIAKFQSIISLVSEYSTIVDCVSIWLVFIYVSRSNVLLWNGCMASYEVLLCCCCRRRCRFFLWWIFVAIKWATF